MGQAFDESGQELGPGVIGKDRAEVLAELEKRYPDAHEIRLTKLKPLGNADALLEAAWGLIANSYGGDWDKSTIDWRFAAERWRDEYHATLPSGSDKPDIPEEG